MKSVLISIQPRWCELIASGKKIVEIRKTKPKLETPFKVYIYCTKGDALAVPCLNAPKYTIHRMNNGSLEGRQMTEEEREKSDYLFVNGKVIGEFVCDNIDEFSVPYPAYFSEVDGKTESIIKSAHLTPMQVHSYNGVRTTYAWHISNLVIYDKQKELREFKRSCPDNVHSCAMCRHGDYTGMKCTPLKRPPQSWCYVEERNEE